MIFYHKLWVFCVKCEYLEETNILLWNNSKGNEIFRLKFCLLTIWHISIYKDIDFSLKRGQFFSNALNSPSKITQKYKLGTWWPEGDVKECLKWLLQSNLFRI